MYMYLHVHPLLRDGYLFDMYNCFVFFLQTFSLCWNHLFKIVIIFRKIFCFVNKGFVNY